MNLFISSKRGVFLTLIIFLQTLFLINSIFDIPAKEASLPNWLILKPFTIKIIFVILGFILLWEIWFWKRWALYSKIGLDVIQIILGTFIISPTSTTSVTIGAIIFLALIYGFWDGLLYYAARRKWKHFL